MLAEKKKQTNKKKKRKGLKKNVARRCFTVSPADVVSDKELLKKVTSAESDADSQRSADRVYDTRVEHTHTHGLTHARITQVVQMYYKAVVLHQKGKFTAVLPVR